MAEVVQLLRARTHDRDDDLVVQLRIKHPDALGALHSASSLTRPRFTARPRLPVRASQRVLSYPSALHSASSIKSRVRSSATGDSELRENV